MLRQKKILDEEIICLFSKVSDTFTDCKNFEKQKLCTRLKTKVYYACVCSTLL